MKTPFILFVIFIISLETRNDKEKNRAVAKLINCKRKIKDVLYDYLGMRAPMEIYKQYLTA